MIYIIFHALTPDSLHKIMFSCDFTYMHVQFLFSRLHSRKGVEFWQRTLFISVKARLLIWIQLWHSELSVNMGYWRHAHAVCFRVVPLYVYIAPIAMGNG